jgi:NAD(P)-dependent dehydrogenase (short-subunit alcohol dehydrogenase family)
MQDFNNKTVVITGGASGVGRALGILFAQDNANVVLVDINQDALDKTVAELNADGLKVDAKAADVTSPDSMDALADYCFTTYGNVHILMNNAGVGLGEAARPIWTLPAKDWDWGFAVNTQGPVNGVRAFLPRMMASDEDCLVVNTSSGNGGFNSLPTTPIYAASKAAMTSYTEVLHYQLLKAESKVKVAIMFPGPHVVNSNILNSAHARPERFSGEGVNKPKEYTSFEDLTKATGIEFNLTEPMDVALYTVEQIKQGNFWILPPEGYDEQKQKILDRAKNIVNQITPIYPD